MPQFNANISAGLNGTQAPTQQVSVTDDVAINESVSVLAAQPGSLTTRTNNTDGTLTMTNSGHGITTGQRIDLYWTGGQRYGVAAGTVSGTSVPVSSGAGTSLPVANTAVTVGIPVQRTMAITGDNMSALLLVGSSVGSAYFVHASSAPANLLATLVTVGSSYQWYTGNGVTNPLAGVTVASLWISHSDTAAAHTIQAAALTH